MNPSQNNQIPLFVSKLFTILSQKKHDDIIFWCQVRKGFKINCIKSLETTVLPYYFRHSNYTSFVRQLNMYDFHKVRVNSQENIFYHPAFTELKIQLLNKIRRKCYRKPDYNKQNNIEQVICDKKNIANDLIQELVKQIRQQINTSDKKLVKRRVYKKRKQQKYRLLSGAKYLEQIYQKLKIPYERQLQELSIEQQIAFQDGLNAQFRSLAFLNSERYLKKITSIFNFEE